MHLRNYIARLRPFSLLLFVAASLSAQTDPAKFDEDFDKPLKKIVLDFGPSPYYRPAQHVRKKLTCYYYPAFTVKQYDEGQKGAEWLSIVPSAKATCTRTHTAGENVLTSWSGYFWGARGTYAVFGAPDGEDGGLPFAVFDIGTGRKVFEDSSLLDYYWKKLHIKREYRFNSGNDTGFLRLTYLRVVRVGCNLKTEPADCWKKAREQFGITQTDTPVCSEYEQADWDSAVAYPVSVLLTASPEIKAVDGPVFCWPSD